jgi:hypothetical protein
VDTVLGVFGAVAGLAWVCAAMGWCVRLVWWRRTEAEWRESRAMYPGDRATLLYWLRRPATGVALVASVGFVASAVVSAVLDG